MTYSDASLGSEPNAIEWKEAQCEFEYIRRDLNHENSLKSLAFSHSNFNNYKMFLGLHQ